MDVTDLQERCELGQQQLMRMEYLEAEATLAAAEEEAWARREFDTLARLYLPLQEARRQRRQRCGEGVVCLDLWASSPAEQPDGQAIVERFPAGQLLVAGWGSLGPAIQVRELQSRRKLFVETFLAATYPVASRRAVVIAPLPEIQMPGLNLQHVDALTAALPPHCVVLAEDELPRGVRAGSIATYGEVMALWERLHAPFLAAADAMIDPVRKIEAYRTAIRVDYACELAHQKLSDVAKGLARGAWAGVRN